MASSTRYGGASYTDAELADPVLPEPIRVRRAELGTVDQPLEVQEDETWDGGNSIPSSGNKSSSSSKRKASPRKPAPTTENHSSPPVTEDSTVHSTDGDGHETETEFVDDFDEFE